MHFLKTWLTKHILGDDTQMGAYFIKVKKTPLSRFVWVAVVFFLPF
jgi:hemerythrin